MTPRIAVVTGGNKGIGFEICRQLARKGINVVLAARDRAPGEKAAMSSGLGQLDGMGDGYPAYRLSKVALNALTCMFADAAQGSSILVNAACPGWVRTDMGGANATSSVEQGADTAVWLATLPDDGPSGGLFRDRETIGW